MIADDPWHPMKDPVDLKYIGKLGEEVNELGAAIFRCMIQGIDEAHPETGKVNRDWLEDEIADVLANIDLVRKRFNLDDQKIWERKARKMHFLKQLHDGA